MQNKIALVTNGLNTIGTSVCRKLFGKGVQVIACYHNKDELDIARSWEVEQYKRGYDILTKFIDVSEYASCEEGVKQIENDYNSVDILVNSQNFTIKNPIDTHIKYLQNITMAVINNMAMRYYGRIINISPINIIIKDKITEFTKIISQQFSHKGITINTISPGYFETDLEGSFFDDLRKEIVSQIPVGRLGRPEEIARVVCFLAEKENSYITNANIPVNGGFYI